MKKFKKIDLPEQKEPPRPTESASSTRFRQYLKTGNSKLKKRKNRRAEFTFKRRVRVQDALNTLTTSTLGLESMLAPNSLEMAYKPYKPNFISKLSKPTKPGKNSSKGSRKGTPPRKDPYKSHDSCRDSSKSSQQFNSEIWRAANPYTSLNPYTSRMTEKKPKKAIKRPSVVRRDTFRTPVKKNIGFGTHFKKPEKPRKMVVKGAPKNTQLNFSTPLIHKGVFSSDNLKKSVNYSKIKQGEKSTKKSFKPLPKPPKRLSLQKRLHTTTMTPNSISETFNRLHNDYKTKNNIKAKISKIEAQQYRKNLQFYRRSSNLSSTLYHMIKNNQKFYTKVSKRNANADPNRNGLDGPNDAHLESVYMECDYNDRPVNQKRLDQLQQEMEDIGKMERVQRRAFVRGYRAVGLDWARELVWGDKKLNEFMKEKKENLVFEKASAGIKKPLHAINELSGRRSPKKMAVLAKTRRLKRFQRNAQFLDSGVKMSLSARNWREIAVKDSLRLMDILKKEMENAQRKKALMEQSGDMEGVTGSNPLSRSTSHVKKVVIHGLGGFTSKLGKMGFSSKLEAITQQSLIKRMANRVQGVAGSPVMRKRTRSHQQNLRKLNPPKIDITTSGGKVERYNPLPKRYSNSVVEITPHNSFKKPEKCSNSVEPKITNFEVSGTKSGFTRADEHNHRAYKSFRASWEAFRKEGGHPEDWRGNRWFEASFSDLKAGATVSSSEKASSYIKIDGERSKSESKSLKVEKRVERGKVVNLKKSENKKKIRIRSAKRSKNRQRRDSNEHSSVKTEDFLQIARPIPSPSQSRKNLQKSKNECCSNQGCSNEPELAPQTSMRLKAVVVNPKYTSSNQDQFFEYIDKNLSNVYPCSGSITSKTVEKEIEVQRDQKKGRRHIRTPKREVNANRARIKRRRTHKLFSASVSLLNLKNKRVIYQRVAEEQERSDQGQ